MTLRNALGDIALEETQAANNALLTELAETIEALRMAVQSLNRTVGMSMPDTGGRLRVITDTTSAIATLTTCTTLTGQTNIGGYSAAPQIPALMGLDCSALRRNILIT